MLADDGARQRDPERRPRVGARGAARGLRPGRAHRLPAPLVGSAKAATPARRSSSSSPGGRALRARLLRRGADAASRRCGSIHWAERRPARGDHEPADRGCSGATTRSRRSSSASRFRVRPNSFLQTNTGMAEGLYELAREEAGLTGSETVLEVYCGIGTIGLAMAESRANGLGRRGLGGGRRLRVRERRVERGHERRLLRGQRGPGGSRSWLDRAGVPTSSSSTPRALPGRQGAAAHGRVGAPKLVYMSSTRRRLPAT